MNSTSLISIIIPNYNRAQLIGETLNSILRQTYTNWECIVVDDGSTDSSLKILGEYHKKELRITCYKRPEEKTKGANACRNFGLEKAKGDYIVFFDSDDLMTPDHLEKKLSALLENQVDYVIAKTKFLNDDDDFLERYYTFDQFEITAHNFIVQNINWLTYDTLIEAKLAKSISYNEHLQSGQEFNYFCKLVLKSTKAIFIEEYVTLRRKHENSTQGKLKNENIKWKRSFKSMWLTYIDIKHDLPLSAGKVLLYKCIRTIYRQKQFLADNKILFLKETYKQFGFSGLRDFLSMYLLRKYFNKGYGQREKLKVIAERKYTDTF
jgi:glycosyltransferase involved in cell wall biosynthesis